MFNFSEKLLNILETGLKYLEEGKKQAGGDSQEWSGEGKISPL